MISTYELSVASSCSKRYIDKIFIKEDMFYKNLEVETSSFEPNK